MNEEIIYCANGCARKHGDDIQRITTEPPSQLCKRCEDNLRKWLRDVPTHYTLLPTFIEHGTTERNPDSVATKRTEAPAPMRLEIIDLLDTRLGRKWQGTEVTEDRRGAYGTLMAIANEIRDGRNLTTDHPTNVTAACTYISRHFNWLVEQDWIADPYKEIKALHRSLGDAVGEYRQPPVGRCHVPNDDNVPCNGGLYANPYGGVRCARCAATWDAAHLRQLGLAQAQEPA